MTHLQMLLMAILAIALMVAGAWLLLRRRAPADPLIHEGQAPVDPAQTEWAEPGQDAAADADTKNNANHGVLATAPETAPDVGDDWDAQTAGLRASRASVAVDAADPDWSTVQAPAIGADLGQVPAQVPAQAEQAAPPPPPAPTASAEPATQGLESALDTLDQATSRLAAPVEAVATPSAEGDSALLARHLEAQQLHDESTPLAQAERVVSFYLLPPGERGFDGQRIKHLLVQSGLRFGEMSLFHRFEEPNGQGGLMFSVLRLDPDEGPSAFDLESLENERLPGLAFFLALPNPQAVKGYDMMCSILRHLAAELGADVYDEHMQLLSKQLREHYRLEVIDYCNRQGAA